MVLTNQLEFKCYLIEILALFCSIVCMCRGQMCLNIVGKCSAFEAAPPSPENANYQQSSGVGFFTYLTAMRNGLLFGVYERQIRARATPAFFCIF